MNMGVQNDASVSKNDTRVHVPCWIPRWPTRPVNTSIILTTVSHDRELVSFTGIMKTVLTDREYRA